MNITRTFGVAGFLITLALSMTMSVVAQAEPYQTVDWPHWLGPNYDGISPETGWQAKWDAGGPPIAWRANIGIGFSSVAVAGGKLYAIGYDDGHEIVHCFDAASGQVIWSQKYPGEKVDNMHEGGPGATPTVADGTVYTVGKQGQLHAFDADDGKVVWSSNLRKLTGRDRVPPWGYTGSAVVLGDTVYYQAGQTLALDRLTGKIKWMSTEYEPSYGTPQPFESNGHQALAVLNTWGLVLLDAATGRELSKYPWQTRFSTNATTPIVHNGQAFLSTGYKRGCTLVNIRPGRCEKVYENKDMSNHLNNSILLNGQLYGFDGNTHRNRLGELVCMNWSDGTVRWKQRGLGVGSLIISDGKMIILSDAGELITAEATPAGYREISRAKVLDGKCWISPVLSGGRIYCHNAAGELVCVDVRPEG
ncbi:PQQ-binding-like beta-propeller repeat protein [Planctomycetales bacterium ZRK34]|nr:PQQ-binding-like beta-propeller repeat protein [Planctomycetales bacterium ZRK34]